MHDGAKQVDARHMIHLTAFLRLPPMPNLTVLRVPAFVLSKEERRRDYTLAGSRWGRWLARSAPNLIELCSTYRPLVAGNVTALPSLARLERLGTSLGMRGDRRWLAEIADAAPPCLSTLSVLGLHDGGGVESDARTSLSASVRRLLTERQALSNLHLNLDPAGHFTLERGRSLSLMTGPNEAGVHLGWLDWLAPLVAGIPHVQIHHAQDVPSNAAAQVAGHLAQLAPRRLCIAATVPAHLPPSCLRSVEHLHLMGGTSPMARRVDMPWLLALTALRVLVLTPHSVAPETWIHDATFVDFLRRAPPRRVRVVDLCGDPTCNDRIHAICATATRLGLDMRIAERSVLACGCPC